jgi:hypothetical protein
MLNAGLNTFMCRNTTAHLSRKEDPVRLISLRTPDGRSITGMIASPKLLEQLPQKLREHEAKLAHKLQLQGITPQHGMPESARGEESEHAGQVKQGAHYRSLSSPAVMHAWRGVFTHASADYAHHEIISFHTYGGHCL